MKRFLSQLRKWRSEASGSSITVEWDVAIEKNRTIIQTMIRPGNVSRVRFGGIPLRPQSTVQTVPAMVSQSAEPAVRVAKAF